MRYAHWLCVVWRSQLPCATIKAPSSHLSPFSGQLSKIGKVSHGRQSFSLSPSQVDVASGSGAPITGIFIKNVLPDSPAGRTGQLRVNYLWTLFFFFLCFFSSNLSNELIEIKCNKDTKRKYDKRSKFQCHDKNFVRIDRQTGDRILAVDGEDLREASHERAVEVIRKAGNPVTFLVQSLVDWVSYFITLFAPIEPQLN